MSLFKRVLFDIKKNKEKRESGKIIAIPFPFPRFTYHVPGIQKGRYIIVTANSKVGKSKITDFVFVYNPVNYILSNPDCGADIKIDYFSLEMSKEDKLKQYIAFNLFTDYNIILSEEEIDSIYDRYILEDEILRKIEELEPKIELFESKVNFIDDNTKKNPYGIYKHVRDFCENNGVYVDKEGKEIPYQHIRNSDKKIKENAVFAIDHYKANNPDLFYEVITDHVALLTSEGTDDIRQTIGKFSSKYCIRMRDRWKCIVVNVQQQAASQEGVDNIKLSMTKPSPNGLGENKTTQRDCDMILGLYAPVRYNQAEYEGYNLTKKSSANMPLLDNHREFSTLLNRRGGGMAATQLFFNGAVNFFKELPKAHDSVGMEKVDAAINLIRSLKENG